MGSIHDLFFITVTSDKMRAELDINEEKFHTAKDVSLTYENIKAFLEENNLTYGIDEVKIKEIVDHFSLELFPVTIAKGLDKVDGKDGKIKYEYDMNTEVDRSDGWDFRDVMRIPTVQIGEKIATLIPPTEGEYGISVHGSKIAPRPGKPTLMKAGQNVTFNENDQSFYAQEEGQITLKNNRIHVYTVYDVPESISMKIGNIDFQGSVIVRGDVPSGFTIKATGDIKVFGLVEAATLEAEGSIYVSEGIAGLKEGTLEAGEDIHAGYVNQGNIRAGNNIYIENAILHSECTAVNDIICNRGNIIGGTLSAGGTITGIDIGNRLNTLTYISFGVEKRTFEEQQQLEEEIEKTSEHLDKMYLLQKKFKSSGQQLSSKNKIMMLKLRHSIQKSKERLEALKQQLEKMNTNLGNMQDAQLIVKGKVYPNVIISFGKYQRTIDREYDRVLICMSKNDIALQTYQM